MIKSLVLILLALVVAGCSRGSVDRITAEKAELDAQVEAMKHHPSLVDRAKKSSSDSKASQK